MQQGDVKLYQTDNDGDIVVDNGVIEMTGGFDTAVYLSLFGGDEKDDGMDGNSQNWWGNLSETEAAYQYRSETQNLIQLLHATSGNLLRVESAVSRDLQWMLDKKIASSITVNVTIPKLNWVRIAITIVADGAESKFEFTENWRSTV
jgi:phage gp46-like protein